MSRTSSRKASTTLPTFTPVPRAKERSNGWSPEIQHAFIEALAETGSVDAACRRVGRADTGAYALRRHPEGASFRKAWAAALDLGIQRIEDVAMDRALNGVEVPVYSYGKLVGTRRVYNDRLLMFMLRNRARHRFEADGRAPALDAVDRQAMMRLKKQWRKEFAREAGIARFAEEVKKDFDLTAKLDLMAERLHKTMSPETLRLKKQWEESHARDQEAGYHLDTGYRNAPEDE